MSTSEGALSNVVEIRAGWEKRRAPQGFASPVDVPPGQVVRFTIRMLNPSRLDFLRIAKDCADHFELVSLRVHGEHGEQLCPTPQPCRRFSTTTPMVPGDRHFPALATLDVGVDLEMEFRSVASEPRRLLGCWIGESAFQRWRFESPEVPPGAEVTLSLRGSLPVRLRTLEIVQPTAFDLLALDVQIDPQSAGTPACERYEIDGRTYERHIITREGIPCEVFGPLDLSEAGADFFALPEIAPLHRVRLTFRNGGHEPQAVRGELLEFGRPPS